MANFDPISGNEVQIATFNIVVHQGEYEQNIMESFRNKLQKYFEGEHGHKIVRIAYQNKKTAIYVNAGFEENMYNDAVEYVQKALEFKAYPYVFEVQCFLSYGTLRSVNSDTEGN